MEDDEVFQHLPSEFYYPDENFDETSIEASRITSVRSAKEMMPYNKLLTNLACSSRTGEYWSSLDTFSILTNQINDTLMVSLVLFMSFARVICNRNDARWII